MYIYYSSFGSPATAGILAYFNVDTIVQPFSEYLINRARLYVVRPTCALVVQVFTRYTVPNLINALMRTVNEAGIPEHLVVDGAWA